MRGELITAVVSDDELLALEILPASSSKGSERKRSSSERYDVARGSSCSESDSDERRGHDGKAHDESRFRMLLKGISSGADMTLMELYDPYEPYMV